MAIINRTTIKKRIKKSHLKEINIIINNLIEKLLDKKNIDYKEFEIELIFSSNFYSDYLFKRGIKEFTKESPLFFSPMTFSNTIQNSIISSVNKKFKFRGEAKSLFNKDKIDKKEIKFYITSNLNKKILLIELIKKREEITLYTTLLVS